MACNSLPDNLRDPSLCSSGFRRGLKLNFSIEMFYDIALYKFITDIDIDI